MARRAEHWIAFLVEPDLLQTAHYRNSRGDTFGDGLDGLLPHVFNHRITVDGSRRCCRGQASMSA